MKIKNITESILNKQKIIRSVHSINRDMLKVFSLQDKICNEVFFSGKDNSTDFIAPLRDDLKFNFSNNIYKLNEFVIESDETFNKQFVNFMYSLTVAHYSFNNSFYKSINYLADIGGNNEYLIKYSEDNDDRFKPASLNKLYEDHDYSKYDKSAMISRRNMLTDLISEFSILSCSMFYTFKNRLLEYIPDSENKYESKAFNHVYNTFNFHEKSLDNNHQEINDLLKVHKDFLTANENADGKVISSKNLNLYYSLIKINETSLKILHSVFEKLEPRVMCDGKGS